MILFFGLDLAWGRRNTSGGCVLRWNARTGADVVRRDEALGDDAEILRWFAHWDRLYGQEGLIIGIDAPLRVPNATGQRPCDVEVRRRFGRFEAGPHPANRTLFKDDIRGERLLACLRDRGIVHDPFLSEPRQCGVRRVMEVFPHPAHVVLFDLPRTLKYKAKPGRDYPSRWAAFAAYAAHLRRLAQSDPPLHLPDDWPAADIQGKIGGGLKRYEDGLDALTCAYIVYRYWWFGAAGADVIGEADPGAIVVPRR